VAARYLAVQKETIATLLIYIISPIVIFSGVVVAPQTIASITLPLLAYGISTLLCLSFYILGTRIWTGSEKNILAFSAGAGNVGYFGLPVIIALFGEQAFSYAVLFIFGLVLYECTLGYYITAKGRYSTRESLIKLVKLPTIYAFLLGAIINILHINIGGNIQEAVLSVRGAYSVLGMMLVGAGLASITKWQIDYVFTGFSFVAKFIAYPLLVCSIIYIDMQVLHVYSPTIYQVLILLSIVPLASNTVAFAVKLDVHPSKMAMSVFLSTMFAIVYIPIMISLLQKWI
jgi:predicted permease